MAASVKQLGYERDAQPSLSDLTEVWRPLFQVWARPGSDLSFLRSLRLGVQDLSNIATDLIPLALTYLKELEFAMSPGNMGDVLAALEGKTFPNLVRLTIVCLSGKKPRKAGPEENFPALLKAGVFPSLEYLSTNFQPSYGTSAHVDWNLVKIGSGVKQCSRLKLLDIFVPQQQHWQLVAVIQGFFALNLSKTIPVDRMEEICQEKLGLPLWSLRFGGRPLIGALGPHLGSLEVYKLLAEKSFQPLSEMEGSEEKLRNWAWELATSLSWRTYCTVPHIDSFGLARIQELVKYGALPGTGLSALEGGNPFVSYALQNCFWRDEGAYHTRGKEILIKLTETDPRNFILFVEGNTPKTYEWGLHILKNVIPASQWKTTEEVRARAALAIWKAAFAGREDAKIARDGPFLVDFFSPTVPEDLLLFSQGEANELRNDGNGVTFDETRKFVRSLIQRGKGPKRRSR